MRLRNARRLPRNTRSGATIIEILMSMVVLLVALGGMLGSFTSFAALTETSREKHLATLAAQRLLEQMQLADFEQVFTRFNGTAADDPAFGASPGPNFAVLGLTPRAGDPDGMAGQIQFPEDPAVAGLLREDLVDPGFGMPRDLDGDGDQSANNVASSYAVLPVRVVIEWGGSSSNSFELQTVLRSNR